MKDKITCLLSLYKLPLVFLLGMLVVFGARFILLKDNSVHYHANFGLYIKGQRQEFKSFTFYEEVASCSGDDLNNPKTRAHMHDQKNNVVHVHDNATTWGHFFANLGYDLGNTVLKTDEDVYVNDESSKLTFTLNGKAESSIANRPINSEDVLLVSYGSEPETELKKQYETITKDAGAHNKHPDPAACSGSKSLTLGQRLKQTFKLAE